MYIINFLIKFSIEGLHDTNLAHNNSDAFITTI
jgi:hypothetical protein